MLRSRTARQILSSRLKRKFERTSFFLYPVIIRVSELSGFEAEQLCCVAGLQGKSCHPDQKEVRKNFLFLYPVIIRAKEEFNSNEII